MGDSKIEEVELQKLAEFEFVRDETDMGKISEFLAAYETYKKNSKELIRKIKAHNHTATEAKTPPFWERICDFLTLLEGRKYSLDDLTKELLAKGEDTILKALNDYEDASFLWDGEDPASHVWTGKWRQIFDHEQKGCKKYHVLKTILSSEDAPKSGENKSLLIFIKIAMYEKKLSLSKKEIGVIERIFHHAGKNKEYISLSKSKNIRVEFLKLMLQRADAASTPLFCFLGSRVVMLEYILGLEYDEISAVKDAAKDYKDPSTGRRSKDHEIWDMNEWQLLTEMFENKNELMKWVKNPKGLTGAFRKGNSIDEIHDKFYFALKDIIPPTRKGTTQRRDSLKPARDENARKAILRKHLTVDQLEKFRTNFQSIVREVEDRRATETREETEARAEQRNRESAAIGDLGYKRRTRHS